MDKVQPARGLSDPYKNPELFRWLDSLEGVPDFLGPAETDVEREGWSDWQRRGNHFFGLGVTTLFSQYPCAEERFYKVNYSCV